MKGMKPDLSQWQREFSDVNGDFPEPGELFQIPYAAPWLHSVLPPEEGPNHASQLCWSSKGELLCTWMAGSGEGTAGMNIVLSSLSGPNGIWSAPVRISEDDSRSEQNPLLWREPGGRLHLLHTAQSVREPGSSRTNDEAFSMQWTARLRIRSSDDDGATWNSSRDLIDTTAFCRHSPLLLGDGSWLLPIYRSTEEGGQFGHDYSEVLHLDQRLQVLKSFSVPRSTGRVHGSLVPSTDSDGFLLFLRSRLADRVYRSTAKLNYGGNGDLDLHFSEPIATSLPNNNSSIQAKRLASGRLVIVFNRFSIQADQPQHWGDAVWPRTRWPLSMAISEDDGLTWPWIRDLDGGQGFCGSENWFLNGRLGYPAIEEGPEGNLHITYSWMNQTAIRYLNLEENDILGATSGELS